MPDTITTIITQLDRQKTAIDKALAALRTIETAPATPRIESDAAPEASVRKVKKRSAATRRKMALAQKASWAKRKGEIEPPTATQEPSKAKRKISAEGMKRIIAATKKRWRLKRAADKAAQTKKVA